MCVSQGTVQIKHREQSKTEGIKKQKSDIFLLWWLSIRDMSTLEVILQPKGIFHISNTHPLWAWKVCLSYWQTRFIRHISHTMENSVSITVSQSITEDDAKKRSMVEYVFLEHAVPTDGQWISGLCCTNGVKTSYGCCVSFPLCEILWLFESFLFSM